MTTVTGTYAINFAVLSDADPYTNPNFVELQPSAARIASGVWRSVDNATNARWQLDPAVYVPGTVIRSKIEVSTAGSGIDGIYTGVLDDEGNGYIVLVGTSALVRWRLDEFAPYYDSGAEELVSVANGDRIELEYDKSTGNVTVYRNGSAVPALDLSDSTYASNPLAPVLLQQPGNLGLGGIISFAADGVAVENLGLRIAGIHQPNNDALVDNASGVDAVVYNQLGGTELWQGTVNIVGANVEIDSDDLGEIDDEVFLVLRWYVGSTPNVHEYTYAATETVINLGA